MPATEQSRVPCPRLRGHTFARHVFFPGHFLSEIVASKEIKENSGNVQFRLKHYKILSLKIFIEIEQNILLKLIKDLL